MSISDLARQMGVSRTTAQQRLRKLEESAVITGYTVQLGDEYRGSLIQAHTNLVIKPKETAQVTAALEKLPQIETLYTVSGKIDLIALIRCRSAALLDECLDEIAAIPGILSTDTAIVLRTKFERS